MKVRLSEQPQIRDELLTNMAREMIQFLLQGPAKEQGLKSRFGGDVLG